MINTLQKTQEFFSHFTPLIYKKGELILRAEDSPNGVYYIEKGVVRQYIINGSGEMLMLQVYRTGAFFPMTWVISDAPNRYFFEAASAVSVRRAPKGEVLQFFSDYPQVLYDFTKRLLTGVSGLWSRIESLVLESAYAKTILLLLYYAQRFGHHSPDGIMLDLTPTHREIAAWIGTTRETASLQVEALKKRKLLKSHGRQLIIASIAALEKELSSARTGSMSVG